MVMLAQPTELTFPSEDHIGFDWQAIKKACSLTDQHFHQFKQSSRYVSLCIRSGDTDGDWFEYGLNKGFLWQDTKNGLPGMKKPDILSLITQINTLATSTCYEGITSFGDNEIRWSMRRAH